MALIDSLINQGYLKTPRIIEAFRRIKRVDFMPEDVKDLAELNTAVSIGKGQTISQPLVVAFMLELLQPKPGEKILDIGSGSGWTSALLAYIVSQHCHPEARSAEGSRSKCTDNGTLRFAQGDNLEEAKVIAIELIPELKEFGEKNTAKYNFIEKGVAQFICADGSKGHRKEAPFDKILASASAQKIPQAWKKQLKIGGRVVTPIGTSIWLLEKKSESKFTETEHPGFVFVPLVKR